MQVTHVIQLSWRPIPFYSAYYTPLGDVMRTAAASGLSVVQATPTPSSLAPQFSAVLQFAKKLQLPLPLPLLRATQQNSENSLNRRGTRHQENNADISSGGCSDRRRPVEGREALSSSGR